MSLIKCPECSREVSSHAPVCPHCGVKIENNVKRCPVCGGFVLMNETQCPHCHTKFITAATQAAPVSPTSPEIPDSSDSPERLDNPEIPVSSVSPETLDFSVPKKPKKHHPNRWFYFWLIFSFLGLAVGGYFYYTSQRAKQEAELYANLPTCRDPQNFKDFLEEFPESTHADTVTLWLNALEEELSLWQTATQSREQKQLKSFIEKYPSSPLIKEANILIDSLDWNKAQTSASTSKDLAGRLAAYRTYTKNHEDGVFYQQASHLRDSLQKLYSDSIKKVQELAAAKAAAAKKAAAKKKSTSRQTQKSTKTTTKSKGKK